MSNTAKLQNELNKLDIIQVFEFEVTDLRTKKDDWLMIYFTLDNDKFNMQRIAFNQKEEESPNIASTSIDIDEDWNLDNAIEAEYFALLEEINNSEWYKLKDK